MTRTILIAAGLALAVMLTAAPANAQTAIRTYVSITGNDTNPCSLTAPCRHFQAAANATAAGGEVDALDPGGYGSVTINQAITIDGEGWSYLAPPASGAAITINAGSGNVVLRGLSLNGVGVANASGIAFNIGAPFSASESLDVQNSVIQNFTDGGISFKPNDCTCHISVSNTLVLNNGSYGIEIFPNTGTTNGVLDHVEIENNAGNGLLVTSLASIVNVTVTDSISENNTDNGIMANNTSLPVNLVVRNSTSANNGSTGLSASCTVCAIIVRRSTITRNQTGWNGEVISYGDNNIDFNLTNNSTPPNPLVYH
jgi:hypothetical protein